MTDYHRFATLDVLAQAKATLASTTLHSAVGLDYPNLEPYLETLVQDGIAARVEGKRYRITDVGREAFRKIMLGDVA